MANKVINEIVIIEELKILSGGELKEENKELVEKWSVCDFEMMNGSEIGELRKKIEVVMRDEKSREAKNSKLRVIKNSEIREWREEVKKIMWEYFNKNRLNLSEDIGDFREDIIVDLMKGCDVKEVFELYGGVGILKVG
jgi:hypothetical protein